jgi:CRISPR-associated protein Cas1
LAFDGRHRRPPTDVINAALSYGYGILHSHVQRALYLVGLEPAAGFLHTDRWGRSSLTLDVIELFRQPVVDRAILTLARRRQLLAERHAEEQGNGVLLNADGRRLVAGQVLGRLDADVTVAGQHLTWKQVVFLQSRALASYLLGHRPDFRPYVHRWA